MKRLIVSVLGLIFILLSPERDLLADLTVVFGFTLNSILIIYDMYIRKNTKKTKYSMIFSNILLLFGFLFGYISPIYMFIPFGYHLLLSMLIMITIHLTIKNIYNSNIYSK